MNYREYLKSPEWDIRRQATFERDGYRCVVCNNASTLQCHHRTYDHIGNEPIEDLTTLCEKCHLAYHSPVNVYRTPTGKRHEYVGDGAPASPEEVGILMDGLRKRLGWKVSP